MFCARRRQFQRVCWSFSTPNAWHADTLWMKASVCKSPKSLTFYSKANSVMFSRIITNGTEALMEMFVSLKCDPDAAVFAHSFLDVFIVKLAWYWHCTEGNVGIHMWHESQLKIQNSRSDSREYGRKRGRWANGDTRRSRHETCHGESARRHDRKANLQVENRSCVLLRSTWTELLETVVRTDIYMFFMAMQQENTAANCCDLTLKRAS